MNAEFFKDVPGYEGLYQVSNQGKVRSLKYGKQKMLTTNKAGNGYLYVNLCKDGKCKSIAVHQLVAEAFLNHKIGGFTLVVDHINSVKTDNRSENLQLLTVRQNTIKGGLDRNMSKGIFSTSQMNINQI